MIFSIRRVIPGFTAAIYSSTGALLACTLPTGNRNTAALRSRELMFALSR